MTYIGKERWYKGQLQNFKMDEKLNYNDRLLKKKNPQTKLSQKPKLPKPPVLPKRYDVFLMPRLNWLG